MCLDIPPGMDPKPFGLVPRRYREDAVQEAWVGYLEALRAHDSEGDARRAGLRRMKAYAMREYKIERHQIAEPRAGEGHDDSTAMTFGQRRKSTKFLQGKWQEHATKPTKSERRD